MLSNRSAPLESPLPSDAMRIGLTSWASTIDALVDQALHAEADGFSSLWYASGVTG